MLSFEVGGRAYSVGPHGTVVAGDHCRCNCELRVSDRSSAEGYGNDADRVEFRFRDANNRIDLKCGRTSVPGTWLSVSHISGEALITPSRPAGTGALALRARITPSSSPSSRRCTLDGGGSPRLSRRRRPGSCSRTSRSRSRATSIFELDRGCSSARWST